MLKKIIFIFIPLSLFAFDTIDTGNSCKINPQEIAQECGVKLCGAPIENKTLDDRIKEISNSLDSNKYPDIQNKLDLYVSKHLEYKKKQFVELKKMIKEGNTEIDTKLSNLHNYASAISILFSDEEKVNLMMSRLVFENGFYKFKLQENDFGDLDKETQGKIKFLMNMKGHNRHMNYLLFDSIFTYINAYYPENWQVTMLKELKDSNSYMQKICTEWKRSCADSLNTKIQNINNIGELSVGDLERVNEKFLRQLIIIELYEASKKDNRVINKKLVLEEEKI